MALTQANRPIKLNTVLGPDTLLLLGFSGHESLSHPFVYETELVSEDPAIDADKLLRTSAALSLVLEDGEERTVHGMVSRFVQLHQDEGLTFYRARIVPWLWFLELSRDARIFQKLTVLEIVEKVFRDRGFSDFEIRCQRSYPKREYCVQYQESDLAFVSRLLEVEGIFYFFEHAQDKHVLILGDDNSAFVACPHKEKASMRTGGHVEEEGIHRLRWEHSVHTGTVTLRDYDPLQPTLDLTATLSGDEQQELYEYPGAYALKMDEIDRQGALLDEAERYARLRLELQEVRGQYLYGDGDCRAFAPGYQFELEEHYRADANAKYVLTSVSHSAHAPDFRSGDGGALDYTNQFTCIPADVPYRPELKTKKPVVEGTQTAVVVGKAGEEIWTDKYGRVKVQFHWDREGKKDENSSCWVRVATPWGGKGYGSVSIPRIGNEVIVDFLEGDPDQPIIVGSVYNADQMPPVGGIQMGMKSRSSKGGGGYNEISATDTKGKEKLTIHAQYDMSTTVGHDETHSVANNRTSNVDVDETTTIGANQALNVSGNQDVDVSGNQSLHVGGNRTIAVDGNEDHSVSGSQGVTVSGDRTVEVSGADDISSGADMKHGAGANLELSAGINLKAGAAVNLEGSAGVNAALSAGAEVKIEAGAKITLSAGGSMIEIGPAGITIQTGAIVTVTGATIKLN